MKSAHVIADFHVIPRSPLPSPDSPRSAFGDVVPKVPFLNIAPVGTTKRGRREGHGGWAGGTGNNRI